MVFKCEEGESGRLGSTQHPDLRDTWLGGKGADPPKQGMMSFETSLLCGNFELRSFILTKRVWGSKVFPYAKLLPDPIWVLWVLWQWSKHYLMGRPLFYSLHLKPLECKTTVSCCTSFVQSSQRTPAVAFYTFGPPHLMPAVTRRALWWIPLCKMQYRGQHSSSRQKKWKRAEEAKVVVLNTLVPTEVQTAYEKIVIGRKTTMHSSLTLVTNPSHSVSPC